MKCLLQFGVKGSQTPYPTPLGWNVSELWPRPYQTTSVHHLTTTLVVEWEQIHAAGFPKPFLFFLRGVEAVTTANWWPVFLNEKLNNHTSVMFACLHTSGHWVYISLQLFKVRKHTCTTNFKWINQIVSDWILGNKGVILLATFHFWPCTWKLKCQFLGGFFATYRSIKTQSTF